MTTREEIEEYRREREIEGLMRGPDAPVVDLPSDREPFKKPRNVSRPRHWRYEADH